jgi:hypothetical protein
MALQWGETRELYDGTPVAACALLLNRRQSEIWKQIIRDLRTVMSCRYQTELCCCGIQLSTTSCKMHLEQSLKQNYSCSHQRQISHPGTNWNSFEGLWPSSSQYSINQIEDIVSSIWLILYIGYPKRERYCINRLCFEMARQILIELNWLDERGIIQWYLFCKFNICWALLS